jgi:glycosyltransferase involved in cell wall biosynthesis
VEIVVSDNYSSDESWDVILSMSAVAKELRITCHVNRNEFNLGAGRNCMTAFLLARTDYVVFLTDDDSLFPGSLSQLLRDINACSPSVMLCNFDQRPYDLNSPLYQKLETFHQLPESKLPLTKLAKWFKLSGVVFHTRYKDDARFLTSSFEFSSCFEHVILAIMVCAKGGKFVTSPIFFAFPDRDFMNKIDFGPYVTEFLIRDLEILSRFTGIVGQVSLDLLGVLPRQSVVSRSIHRLYEHHSNVMCVPVHVRIRLWKNLYESFILRRKVSGENLELFIERKDLLRVIRLIATITKSSLRLHRRLQN